MWWWRGLRRSTCRGRRSEEFKTLTSRKRREKWGHPAFLLGLSSNSEAGKGRVEKPGLFAFDFLATDMADRAYDHTVAAFQRLPKAESTTALMSGPVWMMKHCFLPKLFKLVPRIIITESSMMYRSWSGAELPTRISKLRPSVCHAAIKRRSAPPESFTFFVRSRTDTDLSRV